MSLADGSFGISAGAISAGGPVAVGPNGPPAGTGLRRWLSSSPLGEAVSRGVLARRARETSFIVGCGALLAACSLAMTIAWRPSESAVAPLLKDVQLGFLGVVLLGFGILLLHWPAVAAKRRLELVIAWGVVGRRLPGV